jgi:hypothetical protein
LFFLLKILLEKKIIMKKISTLFLVLALFIAQLLAQSTLDRGPYLNLGTPSSMVVKWRTTNSETGEVKYGTEQNNLSQTATESSSATDHEVLVTGLQPNTKYYYSIGISSNTYTVNDGTYFFKTSPRTWNGAAYSPVGNR